MPLLSQEDLAHMQAVTFSCDGCHATIGKQYCRECDEFFYVGHAESCSESRLAEEHAGHRTYEHGGPTA